MNRANIQILLVEDNPDHAELLRRSFEQAALRARLHQVEDGEAALDYLFARKTFSDREKFPSPDLVLLDLRLPRLDGMEVLSQIKNFPGTRHLPVVVLTTSDAEHDLDTAIKLRADKFLTKPTDAHTLERLLLEFGLLSAPGAPEKDRRGAAAQNPRA